MRFQSPSPLTLSRTGLALAMALVVSSVAIADTIHLKSGRVIRTTSAKQVGDKVEFEQFGQTLSIPASIVLRIEHDEVVPVPAAPTGGPAGEPGEEPDVEPGETPEGEQEGEEAAELPPESDPEYWRDRILAIRAEKDEIEEDIVELRRTERAFMFNGNMSTTEIRLKIEAAQARDKQLDQEMIDLRREARRLGVPPGWLRVSPQTSGS